MSLTSPKRKRSQPSKSPEPGKISPLRLNTDISVATVAEGIPGTQSPRSKVARHFENLQIGEPVLRKLLLDSAHQPDVTMSNDPVARKRVKLTEPMEIEIPETPQSSIVRFESESFETATNEPTLHIDSSPVIFKGVNAHANRFSSGLARAYPSINRLADSKSRSRKRMGTPPLVSSAVADYPEEDDAIVDPERASLTWHDDEITGYDPSDPEDDGEGINGIGFRPTPSMARARSDRRKQQLAEYKSREAREARAKRSERRRGSPALSIDSRKQADSARRVRFTEGQMQMARQASASV